MELFASFLSSSALLRTGHIARVHGDNDARDLNDFQNPEIRFYAKQRTAMHCAKQIVRLAPDATPAQHPEMVEWCLELLSPSSRPQQLAGSDAELISISQELLPKSGGRSGETLRLLRRYAGRACEQGRFRRLFAAATQGDFVR